MNRRSVEYAKAMAASLRRQGYPDAEVADQYCIDGDTIGFDNYVIFTACVYVGQNKDQAQ
jgi:hypothetical protein